MSNHKKTLVPIEVWAYNSPDLSALNLKADIGLFVESLIYYDNILLNISQPKVFADLLKWFISNHSFQDFLNLFNEGIIKIYDYAFISTAIDIHGTLSLFNIQDESQAKPASYEKRILYSKDVEDCLTHARYRTALYKAVRDNIIEVKADQFGKAIENAREDLNDTGKNNLLIQTFIDHIYKIKKLGTPPLIKTSISHLENGKQKIDYGIDLALLSNKIGREIGFHKTTPLVAIANANRLIQSASEEMCDLYIGNPMGTLIGNKLYESNLRISKSKEIIQKLNIEVDFPNIRNLVNTGVLKYQDILQIRNEAKKFREWLQLEGEKDRNALIAYHKEVSKSTGLDRGIKKGLHLFGVLGGAAVGSVMGGSLGGMVGAGIPYLVDIATKINRGWRPIIFGDWLDNKIKKLIDE